MEGEGIITKPCEICPRREWGGEGYCSLPETPGNIENMIPVGEPKYFEFLGSEDISNIPEYEKYIITDGS